MVMGADYYQTEAEIASLLAEGKVPIGVGQNTKIRCEPYHLCSHTAHMHTQLKVAQDISYIF